MIVELSGVELHYQSVGEGEPLLWLHGYFGIGDDWRHMFGAAPPRAIASSRPICGDTAIDQSRRRVHVPRCADDIRDLLDHLGIDRVKAIGLSGGGIALLHLAIAAPDRVSAMVVVSAPTHFPEQARAFQRQSSSAAMGEPERAAFRIRHPQGDDQMERLFAQCRAFADDRDDVAFTSGTLGAITADTLIVFGDRDPLYPVSIACDLYAAIPRAGSGSCLALGMVPFSVHRQVDSPRRRSSFLSAIPARPPPVDPGERPGQITSCGFTRI